VISDTGNILMNLSRSGRTRMNMAAEQFNIEFWIDPRTGNRHYKIEDTHIEISRHFRHDLFWVRDRIEKTRRAFEKLK